MTKFILFAFLMTPTLLLAECDVYHKVHGLLNLKKVSWETMHVNKDITRICGLLPQPVNPNLEVTLTKDRQNFSTNIYTPLVGYWDKKTKDKKWEGGSYELQELNIDTFVPSWYKGASLKIKDINSKHVIIETKL